MITHTCIRPGCGIKYESEDPDPYYCNNCYKLSREIAKKIDAKIKPTPKTKSELEIYDEIKKNKGVVRPSDLGIFL